MSLNICTVLRILDFNLAYYVIVRTRSHVPKYNTTRTGKTHERLYFNSWDLWPSGLHAQNLPVAMHTL